MVEVKKKIKVSLFVHDLSQNSIVRVYPIAKALQNLNYDVEILGLTYNTDKIYEPYENEFEYKTIRSYLDIRWVIINGKKLADLATGDIVYAFKPLWDSFYPALLYSKLGLRRQLILDAEDNELWNSIRSEKFNLFSNKYFPFSTFFNKLLHSFTFLVKKKTVVCSNLQKRYGGKIILHGPDANKFNPSNYPSSNFLRGKYNVPKDCPLIIFAGKPVFYNGLDKIVDALLYPQTFNWHLILAGDSQNSWFKGAKEMLGERCHLLGYVPNSNMPEIIKMCDIAPIIQKPCPESEFQIPAKMLEAIAMGKGIIATDVSDLKYILGSDNGWIIPHNDSLFFADLLYSLENDKSELKRRGENARKYFLKSASIDNIAYNLKNLFKK